MDIFEDISATLAVTTFDPNDTRDTAALLAGGRYEIDGNGVDWYRLDAAAGQIDLSMTASAGTPELNMVLFNSIGQVVKAENSTTPTESFSYFAASDGDYFLRIATAQFSDTDVRGLDVDIAYTLDINLPDGASTDGNDTPATARPLAQGTYDISGTAVDWFSVNSLSGQIKVDLRTDDNALLQDLNVVLYNDNNQIVAGGVVVPGQGSSGVETLTYNAPAAGEYFIEVFWSGARDATSGGIKLEYQLEIDLPEAEVRGPDNPGETRETATPLTSGTQQVNGSGVDWFQIITGPGELNFSMTSTGVQTATTEAELNMILFDADGNPVQANNVVGGTEQISFLANTTGTYFLKVFAAAYPDGTPNGVGMQYSLTTDLPLNTWSQALDFGPIRTASVAAYDIDNDGKDEIFVGTSKSLDAQGREVRPAGLIVLEDDGTVKWTKTFAAIDGPDSRTGLTYNTTSISTQAVFSDLNGDGNIDIVIGVGADNGSEFPVPGQPGDKGGLYALDAQGNELWYYETKDVFGSDLGGDTDGPDGRTEGVYGAPRIFDIDADGKREVIFTSWDHSMYIVDGATGLLERTINLYDTTSTTPGIADLDSDGLYELIVPADITANETVGLPLQGGILHVLSNYAQANVEGWTDQVADSTFPNFRGKFIEQALWSSPKIADLDRDGSLEIIHGTSNFFKDERGEFIKIWNADGTLRNTLATNGQTLAAPLLADLDGNGTLEIIATTINGFVYAWDANGALLFETQPLPYSDPAYTGDARNLPIPRQVVAVDIDNADNDLEIMFSMASQTIILDSDGTQLSSTTQADQVFNTYSGSPVVKDIDGDGRLDIISGGTTEAQDQAVIYRWENHVDVTADNYRTAEYQNNQSLHDIRNFVERFYDTILGRTSDASGNNYWTDNLATGVLSGENIARGFINSAEFQRRDTGNAEFVNILYQAFFDRAADAGGFNAWMTQLEGGADRADVLKGFTASREFKNLTESFGIRAELKYGDFSNAAVITGDANDSSLLRGGAGNQILSDESSVVTDPRSRLDIQQSGEIFRLYGATLGRGPDPSGFLNWLGTLQEGRFDLETVAEGFVGSREFTNTYGALDDSSFVELLYQNVLGRASDDGGRAFWLDELSNTASRAEVVLGFSNSREYQSRTNSDLDNFMRQDRIAWNDVIEGGAGDDQMNGGLGSDLFVFRNGEGGNDTIHGFEPWDQLQLSGFGFDSRADAIARMTQQGSDVVFNQSGQRIVFTATQLAEMQRVRFNV